MKRATALDQMRTSFGVRHASPAERQRAVTALSDRIAPRCDLMNDPTSSGTHRLWKRAVAGRALRPGGALVLLEFSPSARWFAPLYRLHARHVIARIGALVTGCKAACAWLVELIGRVVAREDMIREITQAGLGLSKQRAVVSGAARMRIGVKP